MAVCLRAGTDCAPHQSTQDKAAELRERLMATTWRCKFRWWCLRLPLADRRSNVGVEFDYTQGRGGHTVTRTPRKDQIPCRYPGST